MELISVIKTYIGVDSGLKGSIARICKLQDGKLEFDIWDMPIDEESGSIDGIVLHELMKQIRDAAFFVSSAITVRLEKLHGFGPAKFGKQQRGQFSHGENYGIVQGILIAVFGKDLNFVMPPVWQRKAGKQDLDSKEESIVRAVELYPSVQQLLLKKKTYSDGRAEALLIAHYDLLLDEEKESGGKPKKRKPRESLR